MGGLASGRTAGDVTGGGRPIEAVQAAPTGRGLPETQGISSGQLQEQFPQASVQQMRASQRGQGQMGLSAEDRARHKQMVRRNQVLEARGLPYHQDYSPYIPHMAPPPRGGYSGGVIPRFQSGRTVNPRAAGAAAMQNTQRFSPLYNRNVPRVPGWWNAPPGGWQDGGAVGYGHGEDVYGGAGNLSAAEQLARAGWVGQGADPRTWNDDRTMAWLRPRVLSAGKARKGTQARRQASRSPGGWQGGGAVGYSHGGVFPRHGSVTKDPTIQGAYSIWKRGRTIGDLMGGGGRSIMPTRRRGNYNFNRSELYPNWSATGTGQVPTVPIPPGGWQEGGSVGINTFIPQPDLLQDLSQRNSYQPLFAGRRNKVLAARGLPPYRPVIQEMNPYAPTRGGGGRGWQEGGQLEEPLFPVESELADESPWYPDEDVGYEAAAPMQGGFDIFGRAGG